jgi:hypothetical protein
MDRITANSNGHLSEEAESQIQEIKGLLGVNEQAANAEVRKAFGPSLLKVLTRGSEEILEDYTPELLENLQKEVQEVVEGFKLSDEMVRQYGKALYKKAVKAISGKVSDLLGLCFEESMLAELISLFYLVPWWNSHKGIERRLGRSSTALPIEEGRHLWFSFGNVWTRLQEERC